MIATNHCCVRIFHANRLVGSVLANGDSAQHLWLIRPGMLFEGGHLLSTSYRSVSGLPKVWLALSESSRPLSAGSLASCGNTSWCNSSQTPPSNLIHPLSVLSVTISSTNSQLAVPSWLTRCGDILGRVAGSILYSYPSLNCSDEES